LDPFVQALARQQGVAEEEGEVDAREEAIRRLAPGVEVVDVLGSASVSTSATAPAIPSAIKALRLAQLRRAAERLKAAGRMPARLSRG